MGRSVSFANGSLIVAYTYVEWELDETYEWDWFVEGTVDAAKKAWPSFTECSKWLGREDHAILENSLGYIGLSCYASLVSVWFAPKDEYADLAARFANQISPKFQRLFGTLHKVGAMSNGEGVYEQVVA